MLYCTLRQAPACLCLILICLLNSGCNKELKCGNAILVNDKMFSIIITETSEIGPAGSLLGSIPASFVPGGGALYDLVEIAMESSYDPSVRFNAAQKKQLEEQASTLGGLFLKTNKDAQALCQHCEYGKNCGLVQEHSLKLTYYSARPAGTRAIQAFFKIER